MALASIKRRVSPVDNSRKPRSCRWVRSVIANSSGSVCISQPLSSKICDTVSPLCISLSSSAICCSSSFCCCCSDTQATLAGNPSIVPLWGCNSPLSNPTSNSAAWPCPANTPQCSPGAMCHFSINSLLEAVWYFRS